MSHPDGASRTPDERAQELFIASLRRAPPDRVLAYVEGCLRALPAIVAHHEGRLRRATPDDLFSYRAALDDLRLQSAEDFAAALGDVARLAA